MTESAALKFITPDNFNDFTYSKNWHFNYFKINKFDTELFKKEVDPLDCDLKVYQDLFMYCFIKDNIGKGSKILDIGGGHSRILKHFSEDYECWNLDKFEGIGNGPTEAEESDFKIIYDYIGNFNKEIPDNYFDLVFSISTLEHVPQDDIQNFENIIKDINRILKPGGYSAHCLDCLWKFTFNMVWANPITEYFHKNENTFNQFIPYLKAAEDPELYGMSEFHYKKSWEFTTGKPYKQFGKPFSYNTLWQKPLK